MAQVSHSTINETLPGIVTDQPEIFESIPSSSEEANAENIVTDSIDVDNELLDGTFDLKEIPIREAFSFFAEREQQIAQFFIQRYGEYKIRSEKPEEETDVEKYYRLISEVTELLDKFKSGKNDNLNDIDASKVYSLNSNKIVHNLEQLSSQLKVLEFAAQDGSLNPTQSQLIDIKARLEQQTSGSQTPQEQPSKASSDSVVDKSQISQHQDSARLIRMSALERRLNQLEKLLGHNADNENALFERTKCDSLYEAADVLSSWLSHFKTGNFDKVNKELDYLTHKLEIIKEKQPDSDDLQLDTNTRSALSQLCNMVTATDKYRAMVPTIINRLNTMEELQHKAAQVLTTVNHLEQVQSKIEDGVKSNEEELGSLKVMFAKNIDLMREFSADIDSRISALRNRDEDC